MSILNKTGRAVYKGDFLFVLGSGRSGNTLVRKLLVENFRIYIPAETYAISGALDDFSRSSSLNWEARVRLVLSAFEYQDDFYTISRRPMNQVYKTCVQLPRARQTFGDIMMEMWSFWADDAGVEYRLAGDKTPLNMYSINMIARAFPNAHFLFVTRHPYDVCSSYLKMGRYATVESAAQRWVMAHNNWLKFRSRYPKAVGRVLRYEELVGDPETQISAIGNWLQAEPRVSPLGPDVFWGDLDVYKHHAGTRSDVNTNSVGKAAESLADSDRELIAGITGRLATQYGYNL